MLLNVSIKYDKKLQPKQPFKPDSVITSIWLKHVP